MRECFRNLNQTLQLEYTKLGLKEKLRGRRMSITATQKFQRPFRKAKLQTSKTASLQSEWKKPMQSTCWRCYLFQEWAAIIPGVYRVLRKRQPSIYLTSFLPSFPPQIFCLMFSTKKTEDRKWTPAASDSTSGSEQGNLQPCSNESAPEWRMAAKALTCSAFDQSPRAEKAVSGPDICYSLLNKCPECPFLTIWGQSHCYFNNRTLRREVSTGVWRRGVGSIRGSFWIFYLNGGLNTKRLELNSKSLDLMKEVCYNLKLQCPHRLMIECLAPGWCCVVLGVLCSLQEEGPLYWANRNRSWKVMSRPQAPVCPLHLGLPWCGESGPGSTTASSAVTFPSP